MKYTTKGVKDCINKTNVYKYVTDYDILHYYTPFTNESKVCINSIFTKDKTPSLHIDYLKGVYKDFSSGKGGKGCQFVMDKFNCTLIEALKIIVNDFRLPLDLGEYKEPSLTIIGYADKNIPEYIKKESLLEVKRKQFTIRELEFWKQFNINTSLLKLGKINSLSWYRIVDEKSSYTFKSSKEQPSFCYDTEYLSERKIYIPFAPKNKKWFSSIKSTKIDCNWLDYDTKSIMFLTSSRKDVLTLKSIGYHSRCPIISETTILGKDDINRLKKLCSKLIVWMNNDLAGLEASKQYKELYGLDYITTPLNEEKDPSDYFKGNGEDKLKELINKQIKEL